MRFYILFSVHDGLKSSPAINGCFCAAEIAFNESLLEFVKNAVDANAAQLDILFEYEKDSIKISIMDNGTEEIPPQKIGRYNWRETLQQDSDKKVAPKKLGGKNLGLAMCAHFLEKNDQEGELHLKRRFDKKHFIQKRLEQKRLDQERLKQKRLEQKLLDQKRLKQKRFIQKRLEQKRLDQKHPKQKLLDQKRLDRKSPKQKLLEQKRLDQKGAVVILTSSREPLPNRRLVEEGKNYIREMIDDLIKNPQTLSARDIEKILEKHQKALEHFNTDENPELNEFILPKTIVFPRTPVNSPCGLSNRDSACSSLFSPVRSTTPPLPIATPTTATPTESNSSGFPFCKG